MEAIATKNLTLVREIKKKSLTNSKGEPYVLHEVMVKGAKGEFQAIMFCAPDHQLAIGVEKQYSIAKGNNPGSFVIKEAMPTGSKGSKFPVRNVTLDVWKIALETACSISLQRDANSIIAVADVIAKHLKKQL